MTNFYKVARWSVFAVFVGSALWLILSVINIFEINSLNKFINAPSEYENTPEHTHAHFARAAQFVDEGEPELALEQYTIALGTQDESLKTAAFYQRGNVNLRTAIEMPASDARKIPLIELAKQDYRNALLLQPDHWQARYNLELALAIVSEDPDLPENYDRDVISSEVSIETKGFRVDLP